MIEPNFNGEIGASQEWVAELANSATRSFSGVPDRFVSGFQALLQPVQHFVLNQSDPARAKLYPLGELAGLFQACDVLRRILEAALQRISLTG